MLDILKSPIVTFQEFILLAGRATANIVRRPFYGSDVILQMDTIGVGGRHVSNPAPARASDQIDHAKAQPAGGSYDLMADAMEPTRCRKLREREAVRSRCSPTALEPATFW